MNTTAKNRSLPYPALMLALALLLLAGVALAQVPVDDSGNPVGSSVPVADDATDDGVPALTAAELDALVGPIALYPDDLLAIVLPASTYPLQVVQAARFLDDFENDSTLEPDESWDDSIVALLNYPEVLRMMNKDIDWTWKLGEAVVGQQSDVIAAVEAFRDKAYAAGNLKSDEHQSVTRNDDVIEIAPADEETIYVPYYEPADVVVYQPRRVYHYYPQAYPVYYYPYPVGYSFASGYFWGVTTAYSIGWNNAFLHVYHPSYYGHPYYGRPYYGHYWRQPSVVVFNRYYPNRGHGNANNRDRDGNYWRPRRHGGARPGYQQARSRYYSNAGASYTDSGSAGRRLNTDRGSIRPALVRGDNPARTEQRNVAQPRTPPANTNRATGQRDTTARTARRDRSEADIRFRTRSTNTAATNGQATRVTPRNNSRRNPASDAQRVTGNAANAERAIPARRAAAPVRTTEPRAQPALQPRTPAHNPVRPALQPRNTAPAVRPAPRVAAPAQRAAPPSRPAPAAAPRQISRPAPSATPPSNNRGNARGSERRANSARATSGRRDRH